MMFNQALENSNKHNHKDKKKIAYLQDKFIGVELFPFHTPPKVIILASTT
jgi:hypothetical protein